MRSDSARALLIPATVHGRVLVRDVPASRGVLVGFHGYKENAETQMQRLEAVAGTAHWTLVSVQALNRFYRGRSEEVVAGWMTREDREAAIEDNIDYVNRVVSATRESDEPIVFVGFSQGVAMAFRAGVRGKAAAAGVIAVGGDVPPELLADSTLAFPRVLLVRGERDDWYTAAKLSADVAALSDRAISVESVTFDGGHEWTAEVSATASRILQAWQITLAGQP